MMYKIARERLPELYAAISAVKSLYLPVEDAGQCLFEKWTPESRVCLDCLNTVKSAKELFFPQSENLISFRVSGKNIDLVEDRDPAEPFVVFGVRACDAKSFAILDSVFLSDPVDTFYQSRRETGVVVTMACSAPEETCFCGTFGIDAAQPSGGDVTTWLTDSALYWNPETEKGEALTKLLGTLLEEASEKDETALEDRKEEIRSILARLPLSGLSVEYFSGDRLTTGLNDVFYAPQWQELYQSCIGCGTCTFICPTCQIFVISTRDTESSASAAGIPACIPILQRWRTAIPVRVSSNASASASCISLSIIRPTTAESTPVWAAADVFPSARCP